MTTIYCTDGFLVVLYRQPQSPTIRGGLNVTILVLTLNNPLYPSHYRAGPFLYQPVYSRCLADLLQRLESQLRQSANTKPLIRFRFRGRFSRRAGATRNRVRPRDCQ